MSDAILDKKYSLYLRFPDGYEVRESPVALMWIRRSGILRNVEHGYRPVFVQITPKPDEELMEYMKLEYVLHPSKGEDFKWGGAAL